VFQLHTQYVSIIVTSYDTQTLTRKRERPLWLWRIKFLVFENSYKLFCICIQYANFPQVTLGHYFDNLCAGWRHLIFSKLWSFACLLKEHFHTQGARWCLYILRKGTKSVRVFRNTEITVHVIYWDTHTHTHTHTKRFKLLTSYE